MRPSEIRCRRASSKSITPVLRYLLFQYDFRSTPNKSPLFITTLHIYEGKKRAIMNPGTSSLLSKAAIPTRISFSTRACQRRKLNDEFTSNLSLRMYSVCHTKRLGRPSTNVVATYRPGSFSRRVSLTACTMLNTRSAH